jgi:phosphohistidine phosphatase
VNFYLVRHGDAVAAADNSARPLSETGRAQVERTARLALERNLEAAIIYHSGILRAKQTADILAARFSSVGKVAQLSGLLPDDDPASVKAELDLAAEPMVLVGHLPFMGRLSGLLINGDPTRAVIEFSPASILCCTRSAAQWKFAWHVEP